MEMDEGIITRALQKAGQEPLTKDDIEKNSTRYRAIKAFYLSTIEETLTTTEWTSQKKRKRLEQADIENFTTYNYVYKLPIDCAKAEELQDKGEFIIEARYLYTNSPEAVLMYVSNHKHNFYHFEVDSDGNLYAVNEKDGDDTKHFELIEKTVYEKDENGKDKTDENGKKIIKYHIGDLLAIEELEADSAGEVAEIPEDERIFKGEKKADKSLDVKYASPYTDEYQADYNAITDDPLLSQYIETRLASKIALKITGDRNLYQLLYNEAQMVEARAVDVTLIHSKSRRQGKQWWTERLGLADMTF